MPKAPLPNFFLSQSSFWLLSGIHQAECNGIGFWWIGLSSLAWTYRTRRCNFMNEWIDKSVSYHCAHSVISSINQSSCIYYLHHHAYYIMSSCIYNLHHHVCISFTSWCIYYVFSVNDYFIVSGAAIPPKANDAFPPYFRFPPISEHLSESIKYFPNWPFSKTNSVLIQQNFRWTFLVIYS